MFTEYYQDCKKVGVFLEDGDTGICMGDIVCAFNDSIDFACEGISDDGIPLGIPVCGGNDYVYYPVTIDDGTNFRIDHYDLSRLRLKGMCIIKGF